MSIVSGRPFDPGGKAAVLQEVDHHCPPLRDHQDDGLCSPTRTAVLNGNELSVINDLKERKLSEINVTDDVIDLVIDRVIDLVNYCVIQEGAISDSDMSDIISNEEGASALASNVNPISSEVGGNNNNEPGSTVDELNIRNQEVMHVDGANDGQRTGNGNENMVSQPQDTQVRGAIPKNNGRVSQEVVRQNVASFPTSEMNFARVTEENRDTKFINVHLKVVEQLAQPHIYLTVGEQAKLVYLKMKLPQAGVVKGVHLQNARLLRIQVPKDYDVEPHLLSSEVAIRNGITVLPMIERSRQVEIEVRMVGLNTTDEVIKDSLKYFGQVLGIQYLPIKLTEAEMADPITRLMAGLENGRGERKVQMILQRNIPSYIIIDERKAKIHYPGQEYTCRRCFLSYKAGCRGKGNVEDCESKGTPVVPLKTLWNAWIRENPPQTIPHDVSYDNSTILVKGVKYGLKVEDLRKWLNEEFALELDDGQILAVGDFNHMVIRDLDSRKMRRMVDVVSGQRWEGRMIYCVDHVESTPMKQATDDNMKLDNPRYFLSKEELRRRANGGADPDPDAQQGGGEVDPEGQLQPEPEPVSEPVPEPVPEEEDWVRKSAEDRLREFNNDPEGEGGKINDWSQHVEEEEEGGEKQKPKPQRQKKNKEVFVPPGFVPGMVQQRIDALNDSANASPLLNMNLAPIPVVSVTPAPAVTETPRTTPVSSNLVQTPAPAPAPVLASVLTSVECSAGQEGDLSASPLINFSGDLKSSASLMPPPSMAPALTHALLAARQAPPFFGNGSRQPTPIPKTPRRDLDDYINQDTTPHFLRALTPPNFPQMDLMSSTILDKEIEQVPESVTRSSSAPSLAMTGDIMTNLKEKAFGVITGLSRKSSEFLNFDNILKIGESEKGQSQELSEEEIASFGDKAEISEIRTPENSTKVGHAFSFSLNDKNSSLDESAVTEDQIYQFNKQLMPPGNYKSGFANLVQERVGVAHTSRLPSRSKSLTSSNSNERPRSGSIKRSFTESSSPNEEQKLAFKLDLI